MRSERSACLRRGRSGSGMIAAFTVWAVGGGGGSLIIPPTIDSQGRFSSWGLHLVPVALARFPFGRVDTADGVIRRAGCV